MLTLNSITAILTRGSIIEGEVEERTRVLGPGRGHMSFSVCNPTKCSVKKSRCHVSIDPVPLAAVCGIEANGLRLSTSGCVRDSKTDH
jgi:hypothetical protein